MNKYWTEFLGTFFLVVTIGLAVTWSGAFAPVAIGAVLAALIYMGGHVSGAHYNPAVSIAFRMRGRIATRELAPYVAAQLVGATLAAFAVGFAGGETSGIAPGEGVAAGTALFAEILFTFVLALVILNVATSAGTAGNEFYGIAIGMTVTAGVFAVGPVSGAALNPAVGIGLTAAHAIREGGAWHHVWLYVVGPCVGAILAVAAFGIQNPED